VGIYVGNGQVLHAPRTGDVVKVAPLYGNPTFGRVG
jgi:cell wall-associated NlpC family hydrolase